MIIIITMRKKLKLIVYILLTVVAIFEFITGADRGIQHAVTRT